jgi:hypothetical protein
LQVISLHKVAEEGVLAWAVAASSSRGVPERAPASTPLPTVADVLGVFADAGCHGTAWFTVVDAEAAPSLTECPDPGACARVGGLDLGEVSLRVVGRDDIGSPVPSDARVEGISLRKPSGVAVLAAVCKLTATAGPQLVFDDSADRVFVVWPDEHPEDLVREWPW